MDLLYLQESKLIPHFCSIILNYIINIQLFLKFINDDCNFRHHICSLLRKKEKGQNVKAACHLNPSSLSGNQYLSWRPQLLDFSLARFRSHDYPKEQGNLEEVNIFI